MKHYVKPTVEIYSLLGNETICGGCALKLRDDAILNAQVAFSILDADGVLTKDEADMLFGLEAGCNTKVEGYCKFTGTAQNVSWS